MLKPADPAPQTSERPVGELVQDLIEDGKAYARAEIGLAKAVATAKAKALAIPAAMVLGALLCSLGAIVAVAVGMVITLETFIGPLAAGFVGMLIFAAVAGLLGWGAYSRLRREL